MAFQATPEQQDAVDKFGTGKKLRVNAYAGTGKTSTLSLIANSTPRRGTYLAFNKAIAEEARKKFPASIECVTTHALAFRAMRARLGVPKMTQTANGWMLVKELRLPRSLKVGDVLLKDRGLGYVVAQTVARFCRSADDEVAAHHVPLEGKLERVHPDIARSFRAEAAQYAQAAWSRMSDPSCELPCGHDGYLKLWAMSRPQIGGEFVFLDEAQDTAPVLIRVMEEQRGQVVAVGDRHQAIYAWRGARNAMVELPAQLESRLTTSFRFGTPVADYASRILRALGETVPLRGNPARECALRAVANPEAMLFRTNARLLDELVAVLEKGGRPYVVGGVAEILAFVEAAEKLMRAEAVTRPIDLFGFNSWSEVEEASEQEGGQDLKRWVTLISNYGCEQLKRCLNGLPASPKGSTVTLATGHRSKGLEWGSVRLADDFLRGVRTPKEDANKAALDVKFGAASGDHKEELQLFYVAATRAMSALDLPEKLDEKLAAVEAGSIKKAA